MEDAEIIDLYFRRSEAAIGETSRKYGSYLNKIAYSVLRIREDTEEVVQDTYLAAWNTIPPQRPNMLRHFLSRIARNLSFDRLDYITAKCRNPNMAAVLSELEDCIPDRKQDPEAVLEAKALGAAVNGFLSGLSREECGLFLCRYYYSMSIAEVMDRFGLSEGTAKYRLGSLRRRLRKHLEREGIMV